LTGFADVCRLRPQIRRIAFGPERLPLTPGIVSRTETQSTGFRQDNEGAFFFLPVAGPKFEAGESLSKRVRALKIAAQTAEEASRRFRRNCETWDGFSNRVAPA